MQRYFALNKNLELNESDYHHIKNVMRMKDGDIIEVIYDKVIYSCKVFPKDKKVEVIDTNTSIDDNIKVTVCIPLLKEQKMDYIFQKCTEVGASDFIPYLAKRSIIKIDNKSETKKIDRWKKICKEASEQSFRVDIPEISNITRLEELIKLDYDLKLLCTVNEKSKNIKKILENKTNYGTILIVTGPEGGFDKNEEELLIKSGFKSITLGKNVLRAETAPIVTLSMINYEYMR